MYDVDFVVGYVYVLDWLPYLSDWSIDLRYEVHIFWGGGGLFPLIHWWTDNPVRILSGDHDGCPPPAWLLACWLRGTLSYHHIIGTFANEAENICTCQCAQILQHLYADIFFSVISVDLFSVLFSLFFRFFFAVFLLFCCCFFFYHIIIIFVCALCVPLRCLRRTVITRCIVYVPRAPRRHASIVFHFWYWCVIRK